MNGIPGIGYWTAKAARLHGHRTALITAEGSTSYAALEEGTRRAAAALGRLEVGAGERFGILMLNDRRFMELLFAAGRAGAVAVPLNWRLTAHELEFQLRDAGLGLLFVGPEQEALGGELAERCGCRVVAVPGEYDALLAEAPATGEPAGMHDLPGGDDPVLMVYTSGTTGTPKGAVLTHANLFWSAINCILGLGIHHRDISLTLLPLMHVGGIGLFTLPTLLAGGTVVMMRVFQPEEALRLISEERVTLFLGVPAVHKMLVESPAFTEAELGSLRLAYNGGDRCPLEAVEAYRARGVAFGGGYGLTETAPTAFLTEVDQLEEGTRAEGFIGKPAFFMDAWLRGETGWEVTPGEVGEIVLRGPGVFREYSGRPDATEEAKRSDGFHTGDLAWRDERGFTHVAGRAKEMIKSGGENVYPAEVELALAAHPAVAEACVVGRKQPKWSEVPFAVVVLKPGATATEAELREFCGERLARYKIPAEVAFVDALPRTTIGKPDRAGLRARYGVEVAG